MTPWAIVPVKPLKRGKSRLSGVLTQEERTALNIDLLTHTLQVLAATPDIEQVVVVSRDPAALALARDFGARTIHEDHTPDLNIALERATILVKQYNVQHLIIVPMDLPLLSSVELNQVIMLTSHPPVVAIAPDRHHQGTNILCVNPSGIIHYQFGENSFNRHCQSARRSNARLEIIESPALALDVDLPEDLLLVNAIDPHRINASILSKVAEINNISERIEANG